MAQTCKEPLQSSKTQSCLAFEKTQIIFTGIHRYSSELVLRLCAIHWTLPKQRPSRFSHHESPPTKAAKALDPEDALSESPSTKASENHGKSPGDSALVSYD